MAYDADKAAAFLKAQSNRYKDGECWTLAEDAVVGAGGASSKVLTKNFSPESAYVWGKVVPAAQLKPGDVLQFTGYDWTRTIETDITMPQNHEKGGDKFSRIEGGKRGEPQHTAIVVSVVSAGIVDVIEQNIPPTVGPVQTTRLVLIPRPKSVVTTRENITYTDQGDPDKKRQLKGDIVTVVTITETVDNPPRCYRPQ